MTTVVTIGIIAFNTRWNVQFINFYIRAFVICICMYLISCGSSVYDLLNFVCVNTTSNTFWNNITVNAE